MVTGYNKNGPLPITTTQSNGKLYSWSSWHRKRVLFHCDNQAIVHLWKSGLPQLMRALFFVAAKHNFHVTITHIYGTDNSLADALSRFQILRLAPQADPDATPIV